MSKKSPVKGATAIVKAPKTPRTIQDDISRVRRSPIKYGGGGSKKK